MVATLALACDGPEDTLPGAYVGERTLQRGAARMDTEPDEHGAAQVTRWSGGDTSLGVQVRVAAAGAEGGPRQFEAELAPGCRVPFQLGDSTTLTNGSVPGRCACPLGDEAVAGMALVSGTYADGALELDVSVLLPGPRYSGGCQYGFRGRHVE